MPENEVEQWQIKVHKNPSEFYELCENFQCYPDVWSLHEWSHWRSSASEKLKFDTVFFLICCKSVPYNKHEPSEMEHTVVSLNNLTNIQITPKKNLILALYTFSGTRQKIS